MGHPTLLHANYPTQRETMTTYTYQQLKDLWNQAGGNPQAADVAAATALAESGGRSDASNGNGNGSIDRGLWQINSVHGAQSTFDPMANARAAIAISNNGTNWKPWCTAYTDGACGTKGGTFAPTGNSPVGRFLGGKGTVPTGDPGTGGGNTGGGSGGATATDAGLLSVFDPKTWYHLFDVILNHVFYGILAIGGAVMIGMGLIILLKETGGQASVAALTSVAKKAAMLP